MPVIELLDNTTIDKIAAGEVVERPGSVVKELVENSMDSGASSITVEIKNGGIEFIRVTDNGSGISNDDMQKAFLRHATSKIRNIDDLMLVKSMGFRGEALASISAVSKVEVISKTKDCLLGTRYAIEGGVEKSFDEVGAPDGTTVIVRNLFYNTPARRKFLKSESAEGNNIADILEHLALARPDISFSFINNNKTRFSTSGNSDLKEVIYRLYGRDTAKEIVPIEYEKDGIVIKGYLGTPVITRSNRNFETYFINSRFIQSDIISKGIEEGYREYLMQHKFPFCVLHFSMDSKDIDVNVHPAKREVRFGDTKKVFDFVSDSVNRTLHNREMIADCSLSDKENDANSEKIITKAPEPFEVNRSSLKSSTIAPSLVASKIEISQKYIEEDIGDDIEALDNTTILDDTTSKDIFDVSFDDDDNASINEFTKNEDTIELTQAQIVKSIVPDIKIDDNTQLSFVNKEKVLSKESRKNYEIIGQIFKTYWIIALNDSIYFVDQHAAHEKVNYEKLMKQAINDDVVSQQLMPPIVVSLSQKEKTILEENISYFKKLGFDIEEFGGNEYSLRSIPYELYLNNPKEMFLEIMQEVSETGLNGEPKVIMDRIATMACKASIKGGMEVSRQEFETLLDELLTLDNPYHCPHGRPTIFSMSKYELEKKFKRIVD